MVKKKKWSVKRTAEPNIVELRETYVGRYVNTPLLFRDDGIASVKNGSSVKMLLGKINSVKMAKKGKPKITAVVHYAPYDEI